MAKWKGQWHALA